MATASNRKETVARRVTFRRVNLERRGGHNTAMVFCPLRLAALRVEECRTCERFLGLCVSSADSETHLRCGLREGDVVTSAHAAGGEWVSTLGAARGPVGEIMNAPVRCVSPGTTLEDIVGLFLNEQVGALPVLDDAGKPIGIVTKTDAMTRHDTLRESADEISQVASVKPGRRSSKPPSLRVEAPVTARDVMTYGVYSIPEGAPISRAAALMAYERVHHLLVVSVAGEAVGIVSSLDIARWVAREDDYVVPDRKRS